MKHLVSAGIVVYRLVDGVIEYLLLRYAAGHWDFAKGKKEPGENNYQTAMRELQEEAGITATLLDGFEESFEYIFNNYDGNLAKKTVYFFVGKAEDSYVTLSCEHTEFAWLPYDAALKKLTHANAKELLKKVQVFLQK